MLTLLFYERETEQAATLDDLATALATLPDLTWEAPTGARYQPVRWRDPITGARANWDLGTPPLEEDDEPPRTYSGWRVLPLSLSVPLVGPHWHAVAALAQVDRLLEAAPYLTPLDTEDVHATPESEAGPFTWSRARAITNWNALRGIQAEGLTLPRLDRASSVALWRYRVQRSAGRVAHPGFHWPEALALHDLHDGSVRTACLWTDPTEPLALPPVDLVAMRGGCIPADELRLLADASAVHGGAQLLSPSPTVEAFFRGAKPLPVARFTGLGDEDWMD